MSFLAVLLERCRKVSFFGCFAGNRCPFSVLLETGVLLVVLARNIDGGSWFTWWPNHLNIFP